MRFSSHIFLRSRIILGIVALAVLLTLAGTPTSSVNAHANQINSVPAPNSELDASPDRVIVWYSEPIEETFSVVTVLNLSLIHI